MYSPPRLTEGLPRNPELTTLFLHTSLDLQKKTGGCTRTEACPAPNSSIPGMGMLYVWCRRRCWAAGCSEPARPAPRPTEPAPTVDAGQPLPAGRVPGWPDSLASIRGAGVTPAGRGAGALEGGGRAHTQGVCSRDAPCPVIAVATSFQETISYTRLWRGVGIFIFYTKRRCLNRRVRNVKRQNAARPGWNKRVSRKTGQTYYMNTLSGHTQCRAGAAQHFPCARHSFVFLPRVLHGFPDSGAV